MTKVGPNPSLAALTRLTRSAVTTFERPSSVDPVGAANRALFLLTDHLPKLFRRGCSKVKNARSHRLDGMAIDPSSALLYAVAVLDAIGVIDDVAAGAGDETNADLLVQKELIDLTSTKNQKWLAHAGNDLDERAQPHVATALSSWDEYLGEIEHLVEMGLMRLTTSIENLHAPAFQRDIAIFIEALLVQKRKEAMRASASRRFRGRTSMSSDDFVAQIERHHRLHHEHDMRWMSSNWEQVRELVGHLIERNEFPKLSQIAPVVTHVSHVFEGARPTSERLRVLIANRIQTAPEEVRPDVRWFEQVEGQGFLYLSERRFGELDALVGDEPFKMHYAKIREMLRSFNGAKCNDRLGRATLATLHRLRAHVLMERGDIRRGDARFAAAEREASRAGNESLLTSILLDHARRLWTCELAADFRRKRDVCLDRAETEAWKDPLNPNHRRLASLHLLRAEIFLKENPRKVRTAVGSAQEAWNRAQISGGLVYQADQKVKIQNLLLKLPELEAG